MFKTVTPESVGISSENVKKFIHYLNINELSTHSIMLMKGNDIFAEAFWKPFTKDSYHRMYSETKSFVGIAICELIASGKIKKTDKIIEYFKDKLPKTISEDLKNQTIEDMLTMKTCMSDNYWFGKGVVDRLKFYFNCTSKKKPGTEYFYDSDGSFVLGCLVERITGKKIIEYLRDICLDKIGFSKDSYMLDAPGGYTWSDSSMICKTEDICRFGRLVANKGVWNGKQLLDKNMINEAISKHTDTSAERESYSKCGYCYQIWKNPKDGFSFCGMHCQFMHYDPKTDIIFACTSGNKHGEDGQIIYDGLEKYIFNTCVKNLPENKKAYDELLRICNNQNLFSLVQTPKSGIENKVNNKKYYLTDNPMKIKWIQIDFNDKEINFLYENEQGKKCIHCGRNFNIFQIFPQYGYSKYIGGLPHEGNSYKCAASSTWKDKTVLLLKIQIIDDYIGILDVRIDFDANKIELIMKKDAEDFLNEYNGFAIGTL